MGLAGACLGGHLELVKLMIEKRANDWNWGLKKACQGGHIELVKLMLEKGAEPQEEYDILFKIPKDDKTIKIIWYNLFR